MKRLVAAMQQPLRETGARTSRIGINRYLDPDELERERLALFRRCPVVVAHVSEVAEPGDVVTEQIGATPLIITRDATGAIRVFINACRHRGATLVDAAPCRKKAFTCPYHAWTYGLDGSLLHVPNEEVFPGLDRAALGLCQVAHEVRHGFVWVRLDGPEKLERSLRVADFLGPILDDDFAAFDFASHLVAHRTVRITRANWKLVMDAFTEGYHVKSLHRKSLSRFFVDGTLVDDCAPHIRQLGARKTFVEASRQPEETWRLRAHTTLFYNLFPNAVAVFHPHWVSLLTLFPEAVDRVRVIHRGLAPPQSSDDNRAQLAKSFGFIDGQVFENEDLAVAESIQRTLGSGANQELLLGGLEQGTRLFHEARDRALATLDEGPG